MKTSSTKKYIYSILGLFLVFFIWVIISTIKNDDYLFPSFYSIGKGLINPTMYINSETTYVGQSK